MGKHPLLRLRDAKPFDTSAAHFFGELLPAALKAAPEAARAMGGRVGFMLDDRQWIVDLDSGRVIGDAHSDCVTLDDSLDAIVKLPMSAFEDMLAGRTCAATPVIAATDSQALPRLLAFIASVTR